MRTSTSFRSASAVLAAFLAVVMFMAPLSVGAQGINWNRTQDWTITPTWNTTTPETPPATETPTPTVTEEPAASSLAAFLSSPRRARPSCTMTFSPASVVTGESATLSWSTANADRFSINRGIGNVALSGSMSITGTQTRTYTGTVYGPGGFGRCSVTLTVTQAPPPPPPVVPPTCSLSASPSSIQTGNSATLAWSTTNATSLTIDNGVGTVGVPLGSTLVSPGTTTTYTGTVSGAGGTATCTTTVTVTSAPPPPPPSAPTCSLSVSPDSIDAGFSSTLSWTTTNATALSIDNGVGSVALPSSSAWVSPSTSTTYTGTVSGAGGTATCTTTLTVTDIPPPPPPPEKPTCSLSANPTAIVLGGSSTLSWTSANATSMTVSGIGAVTPVSSGSIAVSPSVSTTYTGTVAGDGGSGTCEVTVAVVADQLNNGGFEQAGASATSAYDWQAYQRGYTRVATPHTGSWGIRLQNTATNQLAGAYQRVDLNQDVAKPVSLGAYVKGQNVVMAAGSWLGASLYVEIYYKDGTVGYWNSIPNSGTFDWRWIGFNTGTLATQKPINYIFVIPLLGNASGTAYFDDVVVTPIEPAQKSAVTIMFDDADGTVYSAAKPILDAFNFKGVIAVPVGDLGTPGIMTVAETQAVAANGWEIVSHAINNDTNLVTGLTPAQATQAIVDSKSMLEALGLTIRSIAWPFGAYNAKLIADAEAAGYRSSRPFEAGNNPQGAFPHEIKVRQVKANTTAADVTAWLEAGKAGNRWEVIVFHTVANSGDDEYYTPPATFSAMMQAIADSGVPVVTYDEGLNGFSIQ